MKALAILGLTVGLAAAQGNSPQFAGVWTAEFEGRMFIRLELKPAGSSFAGNISLGDISVDTKGALKEVGEMPRPPKPLVAFKADGTALSFALKDGNDTERFEFRLLDAGTGELHFLLSEEDRKELAEDGIPVPKPIKLKKA